MAGTTSRSWWPWGLMLVASIVISAPNLNAQDIVTVYIGNADGTPYHVPYQGIADLPVWIMGPYISVGIIELRTSNQFISERLGGHFYFDVPYMFHDPEYFEFWSSQRLSFEGLPREDTPVHLADFTVRMNADPSYIGSMVDALFYGSLIFADTAGYALYPPEAHVSQLAIDDITGANEPDNKPDAFVLHPAYPNPFNGSTTIRFTIVSDGNVRLSIFDIAGRKVRLFDMGNLPAGDRFIVWDGTDDNHVSLSSGTYFYRLEGGDVAATARVTLLK